MKKILLIGPPNCGKTMLFNRLTGGHMRSANFPGITTEGKEGRLKGGGDILTDLPGTYSLSPLSSDEKAATDAITGGDYDLILSVIDATHPEQGIFLTLQLEKLGKPVICAVNMADLLKKSGGELNASLLSSMLGVPVVPISAKSGMNIGKIKELVRSNIHLPKASFDGSLRRTAAEIASLCIKTERKKSSFAADKLLLNPLFALPFLFIILLLIFAAVFSGPVSRIGELFSVFFTSVLPQKAAALLLAKGVSKPLASLITDGILKGVGAVLAFLPQMAALFAVLTVLEDSGYMARAAFITDKPLSKLGLCGKSFVPLIMGFGCTTSAITAAKAVSGRKSRFLTVLVLPFVSCGARLPIYLLFGDTFFGSRRLVFAALMYLPGLFLLIISSMLFSEKNSTESFMLELPDYRMPSFKNVIMQTFFLTKDFVVRAGTVIFLLSAFMWLINGTPLLGKISDFSARLFLPLGFGFPQASAALFSGFFAKEAVVSSLAVLCGGGIESFFTRASAVSFTVFSATYPPCLTALSVMKREIGVSYTVFAFIYQITAAYLCSAAAYYLCVFLNL